MCKDRHESMGGPHFWYDFASLEGNPGAQQTLQKRTNNVLRPCGRIHQINNDVYPFESDIVFILQKGK